jgi:hypothetical protein
MRRKRKRRRELARVVTRRSPGKDAPSDGNLCDGVAVHEGLVVAVGGGKTSEVKLLMLQNWGKAYVSALFANRRRGRDVPLRFLATTPSAPAGIGIGPTSSSDSSSSAPPAAGSITSTAPTSTCPFVGAVRRCAGQRERKEMGKWENARSKSTASIWSALRLSLSDVESDTILSAF